ncbi:MULTISPECIES: Mor transcription activator family protein [unclassified Acinetobacter]|uniref:Mor transcription activator family protein n=1 Tax=unclassified Acinetobacter TaxID=196816 RepID=UPI00190A53E1|nr:MULTISPECIES: Mor transcription activator family protein [unclassified Acinetobacter]MBK0062403.1 hypothetical protein [Acinetobacter sp. S55]MBK0066207.1 hypothetical protein [Acinetobacter sp. S54]
MDDEFLRKFPETIQTIIRLTDVSTALTLVKKYGGVDLHFPPLKLVNPNHELAALIGFNNLQQLCRYWNGDTIYMPKSDEYVKFLRLEKIIRDSEKLGTKELAVKYGLSNRWIRELKSRHKKGIVVERKKDDRQLDMFN